MSHDLECDVCGASWRDDGRKHVCDPEAVTDKIRSLEALVAAAADASAGLEARHEELAKRHESIVAQYAALSTNLETLFAEVTALKSRPAPPVQCGVTSRVLRGGAWHPLRCTRLVHPPEVPHYDDSVQLHWQNEP